MCSPEEADFSPISGLLSLLSHRISFLLFHLSSLWNGSRELHSLYTGQWHKRLASILESQIFSVFARLSNTEITT